MHTEVVACDMVSQTLGSVKNASLCGESILAAQGKLPVVIDVAVCVETGVVAEQDIEIGMPPVSELKERVLPYILRERGQPGFGALPGVEVAIELICAKGTIDVAQIDAR